MQLIVESILNSAIDLNKESNDIESNDIESNDIFFNVIGFDFNSVPSFTMYKYWFCDLIIKNNLNF